MILERDLGFRIRIRLSLSFLLLLLFFPHFCFGVFFPWRSEYVLIQELIGDYGLFSGDLFLMDLCL